MSYILYINGYLIDVRSDKVTQTKQVNDIGKLSDRQSSFTNKFKAPPTANNLRAFDKLGITGSNSNVPYQKNEAYLFDADNGECLVYKGWANIEQYSPVDFEIDVRDGIIDFYKAIENKTLSQVGISDLNHLKNLDAVVNTWDVSEGLPYCYMIADYNGKLYYDGSTLNVDYLIPSAWVKFLWNRIFDFFGFTYSGDIFETEDFDNLWMTYPKPVGSMDQQIEIINQQTYLSPLSYVTTMPLPGGGLEYYSVYEPSLLQQCFSEPAAESVSQGDGNCRLIDVAESGLYQFKLYGAINFPVNESANYGISLTRRTIGGTTTTFESIINNFTGPASIDMVYNFNVADNEVVGLMLMNGDIPFSSTSLGTGPADGNLTITFSQILGDNVNFEEALLEFQVTDFVGEVINQFSLTPFKDRYSKNIEFLTLSERMQLPIEDWSDKNPKKVGTKTKLDNYGQQSWFRYKYNQDNADYNDGKFLIDNKNLEDSKPVFQSKLFTIEKEKTVIAGLPLNIYKFWNKEVKDDGQVNYKGLENRFYFMRRKPHNFAMPIEVGSEVFGETTSVELAMVESYQGLRMQEIIQRRYSLMAGLLNKSKIETVEFNLSSLDVARFNFKPLIFVEQYATNFFVNKIMSFIKGKPTKCELIEVKYFEEYEDGGAVNNGTTISIVSAVPDACQVLITFDTDADLPASIRVVGTRNIGGGTPGPDDIYDQTFTPSENTINITLPAGGSWEIRLFLEVFGDAVYSNIANVIMDGCEDPEPPAELTYITITSVATVSVTGNNRKVRLFFITDLELPNTLLYNAFNVFASSSFGPIFDANEPYVDIILPHAGPPFGLPLQWTITLSYGAVTSNQVNSNS